MKTMILLLVALGVGFLDFATANPKEIYETHIYIVSDLQLKRHSIEASLSKSTEASKKELPYGMGKKSFSGKYTIRLMDKDTLIKSQNFDFIENISADSDGVQKMMMGKTIIFTEKRPMKVLLYLNDKMLGESNIYDSGASLGK